MVKSVFKNKAMTKGFSFGMTSGIITTLGMIVGLNSATGSRNVILAGILSIAIADSLSDAFGMHISEEASYSSKDLWSASFYTFFTKSFFALLFIILFLVFDSDPAVKASIIMGLIMVSAYSYFIAKRQHKNAIEVVGEHIAVSLIVIFLTHFVGDIINYFFL